MKKIAIVGGGFSGLFGAYLLERAFPGAFELELFESTHRLGGRIETKQIGPDGSPYDAGAAEMYEIYGGALSLRGFIESLNLPTEELCATPSFFFEGAQVTSASDLEQLLGPSGVDELDKFWERVVRWRPPEAYARAGHPADNASPLEDMTFSEVIRSIGHPRAEKFTACQAHSDTCASPSKVTGLFGVDNLLIDHPGYCSLFRIAGGNEQLVSALAERLACRLRTEHRVEAIAPTDASWSLSVAAGTSVDTVRADGVLVTVPPQSLSEIRFENERLARDVAKNAEHHTHPASYLRVTFAFDSRFWAGALPEDYFVTDAFRGTTVYDLSEKQDPVDAGILSWLIAGEPAREMCTWQDAAIRQAVLERMPAPLESARTKLVECRIDRWRNERGVSCVPGGSPLLPLESRHVPSPPHPTLVVSSDALYDATISGAADSCARGLSYLLRGMGVRPEVSSTEILRRAGITSTDPSLAESTDDLPFFQPQDESGAQAG